MLPKGLNPLTETAHVLPPMCQALVKINPGVLAPDGKREASRRAIGRRLFRQLSEAERPSICLARNLPAMAIPRERFCAGSVNGRTCVAEGFLCVALRVSQTVVTQRNHSCRRSVKTPR